MQDRLTEKQTEAYLYMQAIEDECKIDARKQIDYPPVAISFGKTLIKTKKGDQLLPIPIGTYGNFSFIQAPPKSKKTFFISLLTSVYLGNKNKFCGDLTGHRENKNVIHIDTEQGKWHCQRVFKRVLDMNDSDLSKNYYTFGLRTIGYKQRIQFIEYCLEHKVQNTGLLVIDGIADLVSDVNNIEESNACVQKIMEWSQKYNCHIICVIHSNFGSDKPTGHLGSFLEKKTETQIQLEKNTVNKDWITVRCKRSRGYSFETFSFEVNEIGLPVIIGDLFDPLK
jgi:hypothetical protein|tara:strand:- start:2291 stop:3136 length:846 start_codon:yes stop_codon:yes gene_type:complete